MADTTLDETFVKYVNQTGMASPEQIEKARLAQTKAQQQGAPLSLAATLVSHGVITAAQQANVEKIIQAPPGGPARLGRFKLLKKLGEGAMGAVFLAEDTEARGKVALKVLPQKLAGDNEFVSRFRREAKVAFKLNHANVASAFSVGEEGGTHYYVMEYCEGESLDRLLKREKSLPWAKALEIVAQVARGLKHAHEHGIVHRDIKPANMLLTKGGVLKILDLGLSKNISDADQSYLTQTGMALGTPHYISPEQAQGEKCIDGRSDIYSLGATFYHLLTGTTPFQGSTAAAVILKHMTAQLPNPQDLRPETPDAVVRVIQKMMAKSPEHRYAGCGALLADLEAVMQGGQPSAGPLDPSLSSIAMRGQLAATATPDLKPGLARPGAKPAPAGRPAATPRSPWVLVGAGAGAAILFLALAGFFWNKEPAKELAEGPGPAAAKPIPAAPPAAPLAAAPLPVSAPALSPGTPAVPPLAHSHAAPAGVEKPVPESRSSVAPEAKSESIEDYVRSYAGLEPAEQLRRVVAKLAEVNPGYTPQEKHKLGEDKVADLGLSGLQLTELWPVRGLAGLESLGFSHTGVRDLSALAEMPLLNLDCSNTQVADLAPLAKRKSLERLNCSGTHVKDLSPLKGLSLRGLKCDATLITDLSPLTGMPLESLNCDFKPERDTAVLKSLKALRMVNGMPAQMFWRRYGQEQEASATPRPPPSPDPGSPPPSYPKPPPPSSSQPPPDSPTRRPPPRMRK